jgi:hypothetical protein
MLLIAAYPFQLPTNYLSHMNTVTTMANQFLQWTEALESIGVNKSNITDDLVSRLAANEFDPKTLNDESFLGYYKGDDELNAGITVAKEFAMVDGLQEFLKPAIDWGKAWSVLVNNEGYLLIPTNEPSHWALFAKHIQ